MSIIKIGKIKNRDEINSTEVIALRGITQESVNSFGTAISKLIFTDISFEHTFQVIDNDFPIPADGIMGKDFIFKHSCILDYHHMAFTIKLKELEITVPILLGPSHDTIAIPPRSEVFRCFHILNFDGPCLIEKREISPGIFTADTIAYDNKPLIRILNTTPNATTVGNRVNETVDLEQFNIYSLNKEGNSNSRNKKLQKILENRIPKAHARRLLELCTDFSDIFALEDDRLTVNNFYKQKLRLKDNTPVFTKGYRLPMTQKDEINKQVNKLLDNKLIEASHSCYNSPILLVPKKSANGKKWRMVIDYRKLNSKLIPDKHPLPRIDDILDSLGNTKYFTILDLFSGFHQIELEKESRELTSFSTDRGIYQWKVLPFGLNIAPNAFCRMMQIAFSGLGTDKCFIYMDDIIVIGKTEREHLENLKKVFEICRERNLKLNPEKADFFRHEVTFLGHRCTKDGLLPDPSKIECVKRYPVPTNSDEAKRFTAFSNYYRRFIKNYSVVAKPINRLTSKNEPFIWTAECQNAFDTIKNTIINPPILQYPKYDQEFIITVDASKHGCAGVLSQNIDGNDLPIHFASRTFTAGELNKDIVEKEMLAIHFAVRTFRPYTFGKHFTVRTDHRPLISLYKEKNPTSKIARLKLDLEENDNFTVEHIAGKNNVIADALSRIHIKDLKNKYENDITIFHIAAPYSIIKISDLKEIFEQNEARTFVTTRAMTKKIEHQKKLQANESSSASECDEVEFCPVIEKNIEGVPKIVTKNNILSAHKNKNILFEINLNKFVVNENLAVRELLSTVEKLLGGTNTDKINWPLNDEIFEYINIRDFKKACFETLTDVVIHLTPQIKNVTSETEKLEIMQRFHDDKMWGGHTGQKKLLNKIKAQYTWKNLAKDVAKYVRNCNKCMLNKVKSATREAMMITKTPHRALDVMIADSVGPMTETPNGNIYIITLICELSKYLITIPVRDHTAKTAAKAIFEHFVLVYGPMKELRTDGGSEFKNALFSELCKLMGTDQKISTPHHHESVGSIERNHRSLNEYLRAYAENLNEWDAYLPYFNFCYNTTSNEAFDNKYTPYELVFSRKVNQLENISLNQLDPIYNIDNYALECKYRLQKAHIEAKALINKMKIRNKEYYDKKTRPIHVNIGDKVLVKNEPYKKLEPIYSGPFTILEVSEKNVVIEKHGKPYLLHKNRIVRA